MLTQVLLYALAPLGTMAIGGAIAAFHPPGPRLRSAIQHFAAGVVFAALAVELLPDIMHRDAPWAAAAGFAAGVALMLMLRGLAQRLERSGQARGRGAASLVLVVGSDVLIDGVLIGVAFLAGAREGLLIALALAIEMLSLGLATAASLGGSGASRGRTMLTVGALALLPLLGAGIAAIALGGLAGGWMEAVLALAAATFLFLVTEELLVEAHEVPERPWMTAMFFAGFLALMLIDMVAPRG